MSKIPQRFINKIPARFLNQIPSRFLEELDDITFPSNAYFLSPDANGQFTKEMVETAVTNGEDYIVFDAETLNVYYADTTYVYFSEYIYLFLEGLNNVTLDFRKCYINCYPDPNNILKKHKVIDIVDSENVTIKFGIVEGDKFKRALDTNEETYFENTQLIRAEKGCVNMTIDGGYTAGFMADVITSSVYGSNSISNGSSAKTFYLQPDGRYETTFYDVDPSINVKFGITGGLGFNRLLKYDMDDVIFKFYDENENFISEITGAKYFGIYEFPVGTRKLKVNVNPMDGRTENPTQFGHRLEYNPNSGKIVKNIQIGDNHRGGIANIGNNATIENCEFFNTQRYFDTPKFGQNGNTDTTTYQLNCEDAVSRNLLVKDCTFYDKFHKILLTHNIDATIENCSFSGDGLYNIFVYDLLEGNFNNNTFNSGIVNGGNGNNKATVLITENTGSPRVDLSYGSEWNDNTFVNAKITGVGKANNNTFTDSDYSYLPFTKDFHTNTFTGNNAVPYVEPNSYNYNNEFINTGFRFQHGDENDTDVLDGVTIDYSNTPTNDALYRLNSNVNIISKDCVLKDAKIYHRNSDGSWYFEGCTFQDVTNYVLKISNSSQTAKFYFKDCIFSGSGDFLTGSGNYEIVMDNCTVGAGINMNATVTQGTVTTLTIVEPRTMPIPEITQETGYNTIDVIFHIFTLKIRNKNTQEIVLDKDVCSTYKHYTDSPTDFEYSIDGGKYWDEINN